MATSTPTVSQDMTESLHVGACQLLHLFECLSSRD